MAVRGIDFKKPVERDPVPLLQCKRVLGRFKLDIWTLPAVSRAHLTSQVQRIRIAVQAVREPSEPGSEIGLFTAVECVEVQIEILSG